MPRRVLITGASGFLGAHLAHLFIERGDEVYCLIRKQSNLWRLKGIVSKLITVELEEMNWQQQVINIRPQIIIHCAWNGVEALERDNMTVQNQNIELTEKLLEITAEVLPEKFLALGSQAEYGKFDGVIGEDHICHPDSAYGTLKLKVLHLVEEVCNKHQIDWIWMRIFSVFGPLEGSSWLIPTLISKMSRENEMDMTEGNQKYAYLYIDDFKKMVSAIVDKNIASGVYHICAQQETSIRELAEKLRNIVNPNFKLNFGAVPYREGQSMLMKGEISKFLNQIGDFTFTDINLALSKTVAYFQSNEQIK
jgi:nucleoside-diphosphate-sugar epimerase